MPLQIRQTSLHFRQTSLHFRQMSYSALATLSALKVDNMNVSTGMLRRAGGWGKKRNPTNTSHSTCWTRLSAHHLPVTSSQVVTWPLFSVQREIPSASRGLPSKGGMGQEGLRHIQFWGICPSFLEIFKRWSKCNYFTANASLITQLVKNLPALQETPVQFLGREDPLEKG